MTAYDHLSNVELRSKLLEHGLDLPISINREFLVKKLLSAMRDKESAGLAARDKKDGGTSRRQTLGPSTPRSTSTNGGNGEAAEAKLLAAKAKKRLSLSVTQQEPQSPQNNNRRSGSKDIIETSRSTQPQPSTNSKERRKSASPAVGNHTKKSTSNNSPVVSKRSLPFTKARNTIAEEESDSDSGVEEVPAPPPARFLRPPTSSAASAKPAPSPMTRRSIHDPPKYRDEELKVLVAGKSGGAKEERYNDYLSFFRGSGRGEELFGTSASRNTPVTRATYSSRTYSEDESEEEVEHVTPSRFRKVVSSLNPLNLNVSSIKSWSPFREKPENQSVRTLASSRYAGPARLNNGHMEGRTAPTAKSKGFFRNPFERNGASTNARDEGSYDDSPIFSKLLLALVVIFFCVLGICYYYQIRGGGLSLTGDKISVPSNKIPIRASTVARPAFIPICGMEGVSPSACIQPDVVKTSRVLFNQLKDELVQRANWKGCGAEVDDKITLAAARILLYRLSDLNKPDVDNGFNGLLYLSVENPKWGLRVEASDSVEVMNSMEVSLLDYTQATISAVGISPSFFCVLWSGLYTIVANAFMFVCLVVVLFMLGTAFRYYQNWKKQAENEMFELIEEILELLHRHYEHALETQEKPFLAVNHIRDELVAPKDRESKAVLWNKAVKYISEHESRIREEIQHISGEEYRVWRWIPSASNLASKRKSLSPQSSPAHLPNLTSTNSSGNQWQGQAFEMSDGSPNSLPITPTTCLKIRQMFDSNMTETYDQIITKVESAIREKCGEARIVHVGIDAGSLEGCVYVKCATKEDARKAYMSLHGWWFDGHLLSVKFLREERYLLRFPGAKKL